jgi:NAD(P)-dependent dehydrogenase (short-subunit alcohol dehydrogenase family)
MNKTWMITGAGRGMGLTIAKAALAAGHKAVATSRKSLADSMIRGIAETQEIIGYCTTRDIKADIELTRSNQINEAFAHVVNKDVVTALLLI